MEIDQLIAIILGGALLGWGLYNFVRCLKGRKVDARLIGYDERNITTGDPTTDGIRYQSVYEYYDDNGLRRTYKSKNLIGITNVILNKRDTKTLYIDEQGKVYEMSTAVFFMVSGILVFVLGIGLL